MTDLRQSMNRKTEPSGKGYGMARISKAPEVRRQELVEAARALFILHGYDQTTVSDIVKRIGVAQGLFYYYFSTKQDIFFAVVDQFIEEAISGLAVQLRDDQTPPLERIRNLMQTLPEFLRELESLYPRRKMGMPPEMYAVMQSHVCDVLEPMIAKVFKEGHEQGELDAPYPDRLARFFIYGFIGIESMHSPPQSHEMMQLIIHVAERLLCIPKETLETRS